MKIDLDEARRIAALASLEFDEPDLGRVAGEMSRILDYVDQLRAIDVSGVPDTVEACESDTRDDIARQSGVADAIEGNAPVILRGHFVVPKVIGAE